MHPVISMLNSTFDIIFYPFSSVDPLYGLCAISLLTAVIVLPIFRYTSDQEGIKRIKRRITAHLLELWLFRDEIRIVLSAQKNIVKYNMVYMKYMLKPLIFIIVPVVIIIIQTGVRYEYRALQPGESAIVKVKLTTPGELSGRTGAVLVAPDGLKVQTPALRTHEGLVTYWRVGAEKRGEFDLRFRVRDGEIKKKVFVTDRVTRLSPVTSKGSIMNSLFHPGDDSLPGSSVVESIEFRYPPMKVGILGWKVHWLVIFFVLSLAFSLILLKPFKVRI